MVKSGAIRSRQFVTPVATQLRETQLQQTGQMTGAGWLDSAGFYGIYHISYIIFMQMMYIYIYKFTVYVHAAYVTYIYIYVCIYIYVQ